MTTIEPKRTLPTAQQAVLSELRRAILDGSLAPGTQLIQEALADQLGFSVVPVREALRILESEGQVTYLPRRGYFVTTLDYDELMEICTIRSQLEGLAISRGLAALTEQNFATMQDALEQMRVADEAGDVVALCRADRRFHFELFAAAGMPRLTRLITLLWDQSDPYRAVFLSDPASRARGHDEHTAMVELARAGDADALVAMLDHHRTSPLDSIRHLL